MSRQEGKELRARWDVEATTLSLDSLAHGKPASLYGTHEGRIDFRGLSLAVPARVRLNDDLARISRTYEFGNIEVGSVDLSYSSLPEWRILGSSFTDCVFNYTRFISLRTYSAKFVNCSFAFSDLRDASLGARVRDREPGSNYTDCDFSGADLRSMSTTAGHFVNCDFSGTQWSGTQTMSSVFEYCNFRDSVIRNVNFDGRRLEGLKKPNQLGANKLKGCDFSTAKIDGVGFIGIDIRNCIPPAMDNIVVIDHYPGRCRSAVAILQGMAGNNARAAEAVLRIEADDAYLLPADSVGILDLNNYPGDLRSVINVAFSLSPSTN